MDFSHIRKMRDSTYRRRKVFDTWLVILLVLAVTFGLRLLDVHPKAVQTVRSLGTQTAEIAQAGATGEALAHAAETSQAITDITAILDEEPMVVGPVEAVALQLHAVSPLARDLRYREQFRVVVAGRHASIPKGSTVTLRCADDPSQLLCVVVAVATPTDSD